MNVTGGGLVSEVDRQLPPTRYRFRSVANMNGSKMGCPTKPYENIWEYLRDVVLAFLIIIAGFLLAGVIAEPFRNLTDLAYPGALCVALAPFWWFTRRCQIHDFDFYDYFALSVFTLLIALFQLLALIPPNQRMIELLIIAVAFGGYLSLWAWFRSRFRRSSGNDACET